MLGLGGEGVGKVEGLGPGGVAGVTMEGVGLAARAGARVGMGTSAGLDASSAAVAHLDPFSNFDWVGHVPPGGEGCANAVAGTTLPAFNGAPKEGASALNAGLGAGSRSSCVGSLGEHEDIGELHLSVMKQRHEEQLAVLERTEQAVTATQREKLIKEQKSRRARGLVHLERSSEDAQKKILLKLAAKEQAELEALEGKRSASTKEVLKMERKHQNAEVEGFVLGLSESFESSGHQSDYTSKFAAELADLEVKVSLACGIRTTRTQPSPTPSHPSFTRSHHAHHARHTQLDGQVQRDRESLLTKLKNQAEEKRQRKAGVSATVEGESSDLNPPGKKTSAEAEADRAKADRAIGYAERLGAPLPGMARSSIPGSSSSSGSSASSSSTAESVAAATAAEANEEVAAAKIAARMAEFDAKAAEKVSKKMALHHKAHETMAERFMVGVMFGAACNAEEVS